MLTTNCQFCNGTGLETHTDDLGFSYQDFCTCEEGKLRENREALSYEFDQLEDERFEKDLDEMGFSPELIGAGR